MVALCDKEGGEVLDEEAIHELVHKYYTALYTQPRVSLAKMSEQEKAFTLIDRLVLEEENRQLIEVPIAEELRDTINDLPLNKSPGEDGLPVEVLSELSEVITPGCLEFIQEAWCTKSTMRVPS
ncbi:hypothetical protein R1flu_019009 [Riccia fluitans]|uniref:Uncharacterized protein n=1 Tax=Riccia fluitans TaxID=41844 RepID=A0ABD1ZHG1_9MARC